MSLGIRLRIIRSSLVCASASFSVDAIKGEYKSSRDQIPITIYVIPFCGDIQAFQVLISNKGFAVSTHREPVLSITILLHELY